MAKAFILSAPSSGGGKTTVTMAMLGAMNKEVHGPEAGLEALVELGKAGKLDAYRTPGGHHRIMRREIDRLLADADALRADFELGGWLGGWLDSGLGLGVADHGFPGVKGLFGGHGLHLSHQVGLGVGGWLGFGLFNDGGWLDGRFEFLRSGAPLRFEEGCRKCYTCGYSEC